MINRKHNISVELLIICFRDRGSIPLSSILKKDTIMQKQFIIDDFISQKLHDISNEIGVISGYCELFSDEDFSCLSEKNKKRINNSKLAVIACYDNMKELLSYISKLK